MIELDFFKSKLIAHLREYAPHLSGNTGWIELLSDGAYDEMNRLIQSGMTRDAAQYAAQSQMLSNVPVAEEGNGIQ